MTARPRSEFRRSQTGVRLRPEVYRAAQHRAIDEAVPVSDIIERALVEYLLRCGVEIPAAPGESET